MSYIDNSDFILFYFYVIFAGRHKTPKCQKKVEQTDWENIGKELTMTLWNTKNI